MHFYVDFIAKMIYRLTPKTNIKSSKKWVPKMIRSKIGWKRKSGQPTTLGGPDPGPRGGIKGGVNPSLEGRRVETMLEREQMQPLNHLRPEGWWDFDRSVKILTESIKILTTNSGPIR